MPYLASSSGESQWYGDGESFAECRLNICDVASDKWNIRLNWIYEQNFIVALAMWLLHKEHSYHHTKMPNISSLVYIELKLPRHQICIRTTEDTKQMQHAWSMNLTLRTSALE